jgi:hypothetical protein
MNTEQLVEQVTKIGAETLHIYFRTHTDYVALET